MTRRDVERYVQRRTGITTSAERDRRMDRLARYRDAPTDPGTEYIRGPFLPPGFLAANLTDTVTPASNRTLARYLGQAPDDLNLVTIRVNVTVAGSTITWAEVGIATSLDFTLGSGADLIPEGATGVAGSFNTSGIYNVDVAVTIAKGAHVWALVGAQAVTVPTFRAGLGDGASVGFVQFADATRPSTMASPTTFGITSSGNAIWMGIQW